jgi:membrane-bound serine protease (ClpP class)
MVGDVAEVLEDFDRSGAVFVRGERWNAVSRQPLRRGQTVRITRVRGLQLEVEPEAGQGQ